MLEQITKNLIQSGWTLVKLENSWVCATHEAQTHGLLFGNFNELPQDFEPWIFEFVDIRKWDVIVFCLEGVDSSHLRQHRFYDIQLWYWDTQRGNLFPYPPTNDQMIPRWLKQLASGKSEIIGQLELKKTFIPFFTYFVLGINIAVFLLMTFAGGSTDQRVLIAFGAKVNTLIRAGEIWRFLTSNFIHIGAMHLFFNLYALWSLGPLTEESFGHRRFLMIYIFSGIGGSIASFLFSSALSAGASGAIFGLLGSLLYYCFKRPYLWKSGLGMNLMVVIVVNLGFGFIQPGIDNYAHLGGLLTGTIISVLFSKLAPLK
ncbi:rhomboid family intramembrane serine protease [Desulfosporosinus sp. Sb-LF]|uniref:rhomboid family intramembrane serine protease n=1 Tax=Desulfosporosinus sp. Sb-LF TaxID=2560027 RepID=UPI00107F803B|nr:rhomboid family intramembrane serine protease [Desulfosporosinus sp. Sb-LF]TGE31288.1 rhomboid family intramembrane serine protease [Desulfosporosinus sp. Sb-LF]